MCGRSCLPITERPAVQEIDGRNRDRQQYDSVLTLKNKYVIFSEASVKSTAERVAALCWLAIDLIACALAEKRISFDVQETRIKNPDYPSNREEDDPAVSTAAGREGADRMNLSRETWAH